MGSYEDPPQFDWISELQRTGDWQATIRKVGIGYEATYSDGLMEIQASRWALTKRGIERAARRKIRLLNRPAITYRIGGSTTPASPVPVAASVADQPPQNFDG